MFAQPRHCCCFSLRVGTLILAIVDFAVTLVVLIGLIGWNEEGLLPGFKYGFIIVFALFLLLSAWLLYGVIEAKYAIVKHFATYLAVQIFSYTLHQVGVIVKYATSTTPICLTLKHAGCRYSVGIYMSTITISMTIIHLLSFHFFVSVKGYARQLKGELKLQI
ncbi:hypothetical protein DSO57_1019729 [Entomophthora muscae]|uniref:Uncharacterized protein n=1 Tax=Entomophthora muscae TaxID=34485 RepID=A0ACC2T3T4_9FUNG|nr:hypothetical protein DSO57_1019729 [Entomophthora muscae]